MSSLVTRGKFKTMFALFFVNFLLQKIHFPVDFDHLVSDPSYKLTINVVDYDSSTNEEVELGNFSNTDNPETPEDVDLTYSGEFSRFSKKFSMKEMATSSTSSTAKPTSATSEGMCDAFSIRECIANKKFEGKLKLDNTTACVQVVIEAPGALQELLDLIHAESIPMDSRVLMTSRTLKETRCEEDDTFDVSSCLCWCAFGRIKGCYTQIDIFTAEDRLRIFERSEVDDIVKLCKQQRAAGTSNTLTGDIGVSASGAKVSSNSAKASLSLKARTELGNDSSSSEMGEVIFKYIIGI